MFSKEFSVELILETIDNMSQSPPKVVLFDIGGVCVVSPFQSILDYELSRGIPPGWINYSIAKSAPNGFWHRLETGSIPMDAAFFAGFNADLHDQSRWEAFYRAQQARNPSVSSSSLPKQEVPPLPQVDGEWLFHDMMAAARAPDPWMYPALKALKASGQYMVAALSNTVIFPPDHVYSQKDFLDDPVRSLFDVFVSSAHVGLRKPDPRIYQLALERVDEFAKANADSDRGRALGWSEGVSAGEIVFLDDIGENLKAAKAAGFRTIRVPLGRAYEAVEELEKVTGLKLAGDHPKIPVKPNFRGSKAKI
ncbi:HAD-like domain-containing protein [Chaetomium strumarium]|uniref:HAD-like domain-containing protein n=1 Tax=Chaetomium strumarium TaxID=1170767 RepID=A0AAJ0GXD7_9PEZI|nr:HAD-like domain-containing protein [Chaetomium strumarium]